MARTEARLDATGAVPRRHSAGPSQKQRLGAGSAANRLGAGRMPPPTGEIERQAAFDHAEAANDPAAGRGGFADAPDCRKPSLRAGSAYLSRQYAAEKQRTSCRMQRSPRPSARHRPGAGSRARAQCALTPPNVGITRITRIRGRAGKAQRLPPLAKAGHSPIVREYRRNRVPAGTFFPTVNPDRPPVGIAGGANRCLAGCGLAGSAPAHPLNRPRRRFERVRGRGPRRTASRKASICTTSNSDRRSIRFTVKKNVPPGTRLRRYSGTIGLCPALARGGRRCAFPPYCILVIRVIPSSESARIEHERGFRHPVDDARKGAGCVHAARGCPVLSRVLS